MNISQAMKNYVELSKNLTLNKDISNNDNVDNTNRIEI